MQTQLKQSFVIDNKAGASTLLAAKMVITGTPDEVTEKLAREIEISGANYVLTRFAFGDLTYAESLASLNLFVEQVMPRFQMDEVLA